MVPACYARLLSAQATVAALSDVVIAQKDEYQCELRGALRGMPVRLIVDHDGEVRECQLRYDSAAGACIDLEYDPARKPTSAGTAMPTWDKDDVVIEVGPSVIIDGSDAKKEHAAFLRLPPDLQARVLETMKRRRVMYFRSRPDEHDIHFHGSGRELSEGRSRCTRAEPLIAGDERRVDLVLRQADAPQWRHELRAGVGYHIAAHAPQRCGSATGTTAPRGSAAASRATRRATR